MPDIGMILKKVAATVRPKRDIGPIVEAVCKRLQRASHILDMKANVVIGGSIAKKTYLAGDHDCDIFVRFDAAYDDDTLSDMLADILSKADIDADRIHGSRDYFQVKINQILYEIVPVRYILFPEEAVNVTDCSYLHTLWVKDKIQRTVDGLPLNDHIRIAKIFCKAHYVYGAESYIGGVSGHVLDILIIHFGGFLRFIEEVRSWKDTVFIDTAHHYASEEQARKALSASKTLMPLVLIDPIDPKRNAAAALTQEKLLLLRDACRSFSKNPTPASFKVKTMTKASWGPPQTEIVAVSMEPKSGKKDVVGAKMRKVHEYLLARLTDYGFSINDSFFYWPGEGDGLSLFHIPMQVIPREYVHQGPPLPSRADVNAFKAKHTETYTEAGRIFAKRKRNYTDAKKALSQLLKHAYVQQRIVSGTVN
jgi:tRNA nucleotidyltransferase (CCA-adding enzyme)